MQGISASVTIGAEKGCSGTERVCRPAIVSTAWIGSLFGGNGKRLSDRCWCGMVDLPSRFRFFTFFPLQRRAWRVRTVTEGHDQR